MRIALAAGGTAGHVFPALATLEALREQAEVDARFFGPDDRGERALVEPSGVPFAGVPAAPLRGRGPLALSRNLARNAAGVAVALAKLRHFAPDAVLSTGGYGSFPPSVAARLLRKPLVVFLPDVEPGVAVRAETRLATRIATATEAAAAKLPAGKTVVTGYPLRTAFAQTRHEARAAVCIPADERVLFVGGATQGASVLNRFVFDALEALCETAIVVHVTGRDAIDGALERRAGLPEHVAKRYRPSAFRTDLPAVMIAADLAVMRAGASTLGELPAAALPAILVPGTYAGGHQRANASWLADRGAAVVLEEAQVAELGDRVRCLLRDDAKLAAMATAARAAARPDAADRLADLILEVAR